MKIWVIGRSYPLPINNMQGSFEYEQAKMLSKYDNDVSYLACVFHPFKKVNKWGFSSWEEEQLRVFCNSQFFAPERMKIHLEPFKTIVWRMFLSKVEKETGCPDVIHVHYPANITVAKVILEYNKRGTKIICTEHWSQVLNKVIDSYEKKQLKMYANEADAFLSVGWSLKDSIIEITKTNRKIDVVPNIVNPLFKPNSNHHEGFRFLAIGALIPIKQFDKIIYAFFYQFKNKENVSLTIVGDGAEMKYLSKIIRKYGLDSQVILTGKLERYSVAHIVAESDALICYSQYETFGVPIIEAWSCGLPVVATKTTSVIEKWDNRLGLQISPDELFELEKALKQIYNNYDSYDHDYIINFADEHYSERTVYNTILKYYNGEY